ncbi:CPBP family glutamic-type intramembrane protease [Maribellus maritimus]|uniref:CPBP family glutamic-type intramembrane protease n=1 Tax=Maribellus maritimus TaxID=2870838 RepID=UPI001EEA9B5E|nr:CPBP family glutamic-type intramembrane protease [Maribellus maritimus]MCG6187447.1 CPBP family intramembrane metalloprotease [Maribellus maritimus]
MMNLLKQFLRFLKRPEIAPPVVLSLGQSLLLLIKNIPVFFLFIVFCTFLLIPLALLDLLPEHPGYTMSEVKYIVVWAPFIEELIFRLPLRNFFRNMFFPLAIFFYMAAKTALGMPFAIVVSAVIVALPYIPGLITRFENSVNNTIKKYYPFVFYLVALLFGGVHITNFDQLSSTQYFFTPVIVFYQLLMGLYLGFLRVKFKRGIVYSILIHALFNSIPVLLKLL